MALNTFPATWIPTSATAASVTPRVLRAQFGDGYSQSALDGINAYLRNWAVAWEPIHADTGTVPALDDLNTFFETNAGLRFYWTQPRPFVGEGPKVFECTDWQFSYQQGLIVGMRATFVQRPET